MRRQAFYVALGLFAHIVCATAIHAQDTTPAAWPQYGGPTESSAYTPPDYSRPTYSPLVDTPSYSYAAPPPAYEVPYASAAPTSYPPTQPAPWTQPPPAVADVNVNTAQWAPPLDAPGVRPAAIPNADTPLHPAQTDADLAMPEPVPPPTLSLPSRSVDLWDFGVELGLNGSEGNSKTQNLRTGFDMRRKSDRNKLTVDFDYKQESANLVETANRMFLDMRDEILFKESPWTLFVHETTEYDQFKAFDVRVAVDGGVGYQLVDTDLTTLAGRAGAGFSKEIGGPDDRYVPEAVMGFDFERKLTDRQKIRATADYTPDMTGFNDFRLNSRIDWEVLLDEEANMSLKFGLQDRYDSTPGGAKANDLDYSMVLLWNF